MDSDACHSAPHSAPHFARHDKLDRVCADRRRGGHSSNHLQGSGGQNGRGPPDRRKDDREVPLAGITAPACATASPQPAGSAPPARPLRGDGMNLDGQASVNELRGLEAEAVHIMREVVAERARAKERVVSSRRWTSGSRPRSSRSSAPSGRAPARRRRGATSPAPRPALAGPTTGRCRRAGAPPGSAPAPPSDPARAPADRRSSAP
jgi:hypothetical protein